MLKNPLRFAHRKAKQIVSAANKEDFWALKGINLTIHKGDIVGIIGHNGAGKSTLLKILTGITPPTEGEIILRGRVASLLEVGTGFHPELTGRENIFLNGAILGMTKKEIQKNFKEIVEFSGIGKFLDTPVKYYSSGMYVRLAFSVAAHMEPDILLVDEVLAVGDAEFQKKCIGKMEEVTKQQGRTIFFVSHNMAAIQGLCNKTILLENGKVKKVGQTKDVISEYLYSKKKEICGQQTEIRLEERNNTGNIRFTDISITDSNGMALIKSDSKLNIAVTYEADERDSLYDMRVLISIISTRSQQIVVRLDSHGTSKTFKERIKAKGIVLCTTDVINLIEGRYAVEIAFLPQDGTHGYVKTSTEFDVITDNSKYDYRLSPDKNICDFVIKYAFEQKS